MTLNVAVAGIGQPAYSRSGDRFSPSADPGDTGFEDALAPKPAKQSGTGSNAAPDSDAWKPQSYGSPIGYGAGQLGKPPATAADGKTEQPLLAEEHVIDIGDGLVVAPEPVPSEEQQETIEAALPDGAPSNDAAPLPTTPIASAVVGAPVEKTTATDPKATGEMSAEDALAAAQKQHAASQVPAQSTADAKAAPAVATMAAAALPNPPSQTGERQGEQRGKQVPLAAPQASATPAVEGEQPAPLQAEATERQIAKMGDREIARFIPAREQLSQGNSQANALPQANSLDALNGQLKVVGYSAALAPSATSNPLLGNTSASVVAAIEGDHTWRAAAAESGALSGQRAQSLSTGVNTLKIQLQPVELGMVTARLSASGTQLSVEIQVESNDARQKLSNDSDAIVKALRGLGFEIDKVTIQQAPQTSPQTTSTPQQASTGREQFAPQQQGHGEASGRGQGGDRSSNARDGERAGPGSGEVAADRAGSSLYI
ncbi:flagellar hook-length control protein FliK [Mesorhizobium sp. CAU 1741]|uniref:flagellar hook-length control protein FliK n=1 Tax=Mesorhizobium sp. CAU 1741 TaxID=3140366 RepID=UPI00325AC61F